MFSRLSFRGKEIYTPKDVLRVFRSELLIEAKKVLPWSHAVKVIQEVGKDYGFSIIMGVGDMYTSLEDGGYGHVPEYLGLKRKFKEMGKKLDRKTYKRELAEVSSLFDDKAHRDHDLVGIVPNEAMEDKRVFTNNVLNALQQRFKEEISSQPFFKDIEVERYFDFRSNYVFKEDEFLGIAEEQCKIAKTFPYDKIFVPIPNSNGPIKVEERGNEGVRIYTEERIPITVTHIQMSSSKEREREATITLKAGRRLPEGPLCDIFETGESAIIYRGNVSRDLSEELARFQSLTGLPRELSNQVQVYEAYIKGVRGVLGGEVPKKVANASLELAKNLVQNQISS